MRPSTLVGLIGTNLKFSSAPAVHMEEGWQNGLSCIYRLIDFAALNLTPNDLPDVVLSMERLSFDGLAVTHPFKEAIIPLLTELSPEATLLGAVNTVILRDGKRVGHNTD